MGGASRWWGETLRSRSAYTSLILTTGLDCSRNTCTYTFKRSYYCVDQLYHVLYYNYSVLYILKLIKVCVLPKVHWASMLVEWRWSIMDAGEQSVIVVGTMVMARWSAGMFFKISCMTNPEIPSCLCSMLNFPDAVCAVTSGTHVFGEGTGHVWLTDLGCYYGSLTLNDCTNNVPKSTNPCSHSQDAAVICQGKCLPSMHAKGQATLHLWTPFENILWLFIYCHRDV